MAVEIGAKFSDLWCRPLTQAESDLIGNCVCSLTLMRLEAMWERLNSCRRADEADDEYAELIAIWQDAKVETTAILRPPGFPDPACFRNLLDWEEACIVAMERMP